MGYFSCMPSKAAARKDEVLAASPVSRRSPQKKRATSQSQRTLLVDIPDGHVSRKDFTGRPSPDQRRLAHGPSPVARSQSRAIAGPISLNTGFNPYATETSRRFTDEDLRARKQERIRAREAAKVSKRNQPEQARPATPEPEPETSPVPGLNMSFTTSLSDHDKGF
jgi:hypothetical protein